MNKNFLIYLTLLKKLIKLFVAVAAIGFMQSCSLLNNLRSSENNEQINHEIVNKDTLINSALSYDFNFEPELALKNAEEYLLTSSEIENNYLSELLRLKSYLKIESEINIFQVKTQIFEDYKSLDLTKKIDKIEESLYLRCEKYCEQEILYWSFISSELLSTASNLIVQISQKQDKFSEKELKIIENYSRVRQLIERFMRFYSMQDKLSEITEERRFKINNYLFDTLQVIKNNHIKDSLVEKEKIIFTQKSKREMTILFEELENLQDRIEQKIYDKHKRHNK